MHQTEADLFDDCWVCGDELLVERDRGYRFGPELALCYECAALRGGVYDEREDRWVVPPDLTGLPEETVGRETSAP